jgi:hypothetical protein
MKNKPISKATLLIILSYFLLSFFKCEAQFITFPEDDINTQFGIFIDPTLTDKGAQIGGFATMVMKWGFIGASASTYPKLGGVGYRDLVGELGLNWHLMEFEPVRYFAGFRLGRLWREKGGYELAGGLIGFDWRVTRRDAEVDVYFGVRFWADYREDQKDGRYGDSDAYERGLITNNPMIQENGAFTVSFNF